MARRGRLAVSATLALGLSGCPMTDDYYLLSSSPEGQAGDASGGGKDSGAGASSAAAGSGQGAEPGGGSETGGTGNGGTTTAGTESGGSVTTGGVPDSGGAPDVGEGGQLTGGEGGAAPCLPTTERCNGHDDDCNELVDEQACPSNCYGFVVGAAPEHGYMYCTSTRKATWTNARKACEAQSMRLAWLESDPENAAVSAKIDGLGSDAEVLLGATDQGVGNEGEWVWYGGAQFWNGDQNGDPVNNAFNAWASNNPDNTGSNEDCAVINPMNATWNDRNCDATYAYVCEQP